MPGRPLVLYDGHCGFCRDWARRLARWDGPGRLRILPYQERHRIAGLPDLSDGALDQALHVILPDGTVGIGARGILALLPWLRGGRPLSWLARLPGVVPLVDRVYRAVARRRHPNGEAHGTCAPR